ncbi:MAG: hypothetical protein NVV68_01870 [Dokdonella sp.]|nr:hypothetical protein [Dokdonella sp.]
MKAPVPRAIACRGCLVVAAATLIAFALAGYVLDVAAFRLRWMTLFALLAIVLALSQRRFGWRAAVSGVVGLAIVLLTANQLLGFVAGRILFVGGSGLTPPLGPGFAGGLCCLGLALLVDAVLPPRGSGGARSSASSRPSRSASARSAAWSAGRRSRWPCRAAGASWYGCVRPAESC